MAGRVLCELKAWLLARLQWDPEADVEAEIDDFLAGYYGPAAKPLRRYIDDLHDTLAKSGKRLEQYGVPATQRDGFLSEVNLRRAVAGDPVLLLRVHKERLSLDYAWLECGYGTVAERRQIADRFFDTARRTGLRMTSEVDDAYQTGSVARYEQHVREELGQ